MKPIEKIRLGTLTILFVFSSGAASALDFSFEFEGTGNAPGLVTGRVFGLLDNAASPATKVFLDSFPTAYGRFQNVPPGTDVLAASTLIVSNSFSVLSGQVTSPYDLRLHVHFRESPFNRLFLQLVYDPPYPDSGCCPGDTGFLALDNGRTGLDLTTVLHAPDAPTFTPIPATPVPEPEIYAMMGVGLALLGWVGRRKKLKDAAAGDPL